MTTSRRLSLAVVVALALVGSHCRRQSDRAPAPVGPGTTPGPVADGAPGPQRLVWTGYEPRSLDPAHIGDSYGALLVANLFEGLYAFPEGEGPPEPAVAARHETSADGLTVTFFLRPEARWSDGEPVRAEDFVWAWRRALEPATGGTKASELFVIRGARALTEGRTDGAPPLGLEAPDATTLVVHLERPDPLLLHRVATPPFSPVPRRAVEAHGDRWTDPAHIVVDGPFTLAGWRPKQDLTLARNGRWRQADSVRLDEVVLRFTTDEATALRWYEAGEVQWTPGQVPFDQIPLLMRAGRSDLRLDPFASIYFLIFNVRIPPFSDQRLRCALDRGLDKDRLVQHVLRADQRPATHLVPDLYRKLSGYVPATGPGHDPAAARSLLAEAGYSGGAGLPTIALLYNTGKAQASIAEFLARNLEDTLGVKVALDHMEWGIYLGRLREGGFALARMGLSGALDPLELLDTFRTGGVNNLGGYSSPDFDRLLAAAHEAGTLADRNRLAAQAERVLVDDCALLPVYFYTRPALLSSRVQGWLPHPHDWHQFRAMRLAPR